MSTVLREEKKERNKRVANGSHAIKKTPKPKRILKTSKPNANRLVMATSSSENSPGADADLRTLILSLKKSQCTKNDMKLFTESINSKLVEIESKVSSHDTKIDSMNKRLDLCEKQAASAEYQIQLDKQRLLKNNVSIFGIGRTEGENLLQIVVSLLNKIGCAVAEKQIVNCYRIKGNSNNIIVITLADYELKQKILKEKSKKPITVGEIISCTSNAASTTIYINNHVTPFFGKLLHEGRKAVKNGDIHSCWLNSFGCQVKLQENGKQHGYRTVDELAELIASKKSTMKRNAPDERSPSGNNNKINKQ